MSAIRPGDAFVSLGTSGVLFATTEPFRPYPQAAVHAFCHALPETWHQMGVTLSAAASLAWWAGVTGRSEAELSGRSRRSPDLPSPALFLPYLGGERTPHNDGTTPRRLRRLSHDTDRRLLTQAVLEGVAFSLRDCLDALSASGTRIEAADVIGGGSRSRAWVAIIAAVLGIPLHRVWLRARRRRVRRGQAGPYGSDRGGAGSSLHSAGPRRDHSSRSGADRGLRGTTGGIPRLEQRHRRRGAGGLR